MGTTNCPTKNPLRRDGTSQYQRMLETLDPSHAPIHEFTLRDWMLFAWQYAGKLNYYNVSNDQAPQGDWTNFMPAEKEIKIILDSIQKNDADASLQPQLALFISFLKLMQQTPRAIEHLHKKASFFLLQKGFAAK